jgi:hypothetical protein
MRCMLVDKGQGWVIYQKLRDYEQPNVLLAVESFLKDMTIIAVHHKFNDSTLRMTSVMQK